MEVYQEVQVGSAMDLELDLHDGAQPALLVLPDILAEHLGRVAGIREQVHLHPRRLAAMEPMLMMRPPPAGFMIRKAI